MKTTRTLNQIAKLTLASATFLFASLMPMQAASGKNTSSEMNEIQAASNSLAMYNTELEKAAAFNAPALSEDFEVAVALENMDQLSAQIEQSVKYTASVSE